MGKAVGRICVSYAAILFFFKYMGICAHMCHIYMHIQFPERHLNTDSLPFYDTFLYPILFLHVHS